MNRRHALKMLVAAALCPLCATTGFAAEGAHWGYSGAKGPDKWGNLNAASKVCAIGTQQSPVDIVDTVKAELPPLTIVWNAKPDTIVNNGHTIQVNMAPGALLTVGNDKFTLLQFHFHRPSEHLVAGKSFPMEVHFVHRNAAGNLAVIGVLMTAGKPNAVFNKIVTTMPMKAGPAVKADAAIDPNGLLPAARTYYRYPGSLTTPPCNEIVDWLVLTAPIEVADADVAAFARLYPMNARPAQKPNRRTVLRSG